MRLAHVTEQVGEVNVMQSLLPARRQPEESRCLPKLLLLLLLPCTKA